MNRRTVLTRIAAVVGGVGAAVAAIPFVRYFAPSERAKALGAAISIDLDDFEPGQTKTYVWRGMSVLVMKRTQAQLDALKLTDSRLLDAFDADGTQPEYVDTSHRSRNPEYLILLGNCTHLGCVPGQNLARGKSLIGDWWPGGFVCACHGSMFDYAGRVVRGPAPTNLRVPPHYFASSRTLVVGSDSAGV